MVLTYHLDVRMEPVESLQVAQSGTYSPMQPGDRVELYNDLMMAPAASNGRVMAGAYGR